MQIEIPRQVAWILAQLKNRGFEAFAVGGCVRDTLLSKIPEDWDITTSAKPEQVKAIFGKTIDTGLQHGTVTVFREHVGYEITTYRIDGEYEDRRHPKAVAFTANLEEDLRRRDFTINAMAYSHETGIVDIFGGMKDLQNGVIRCVGDATERFTEDALRILRAIRFSAQLGFSIEKSTYDAVSKIAPNLAFVSKERVQAELTKILLSGHPERIFLAEETGMSPYISQSFPFVFERTNGSVNLQLANQLKADKALRYASFFCCISEAEAGQILKELKMDNDTIGKVKTLVFWLPQPLTGERAILRKVMSSMSDELFDDLLELKRIIGPDAKEEVESAEKLCRSIREHGDCIRLKDLAVDGKDLMNMGIKPGPGLGEKLNELFELVLKHPEYNDKDYLCTLVGKERQI
ncbi:MAG: CCA tRNA nucleotidyltransferase [Clostridium sp.]